MTQQAFTTVTDDVLEGRLEAAAEYAAAQHNIHPAALPLYDGAHFISIDSDDGTPEWLADYNDEEWV